MNLQKAIVIVGSDRMCDDVRVMMEDIGSFNIICNTTLRSFEDTMSKEIRIEMLIIENEFFDDDALSYIKLRAYHLRCPVMIITDSVDKVIDVSKTVSYLPSKDFLIETMSEKSMNFYFAYQSHELSKYMNIPDIKPTETFL